MMLLAMPILGFRFAKPSTGKMHERRGQNHLIPPSNLKFADTSELCSAARPIENER